jgi:predicted N-formylglutamate amidohydrolase
MPIFTEPKPERPAPTGYRLLGPEERPPVIEERREGRSNFVFAVDHAGWHIPRRLDDLGLPQSELQRHIAWDIGGLAVARETSSALDAPLVAQYYSRLVIDCNRDPAAASSIATHGEWIEIPGNVGLSEAEIAARRAEVFDPYHDHLRSLLDARQAAGRQTIMIAQHTMTDFYKGVRREMHAAVLFNRDRGFSRLLLEALRRETGLIIAENQPYFVSDATDYTIPRHAEARGLPYAEVEIRQDLVSSASGQSEWARRLAAALRESERAFFAASGPDAAPA